MSRLTHGLWKEAHYRILVAGVVGLVSVDCIGGIPTLGGGNNAAASVGTAVTIPPPVAFSAAQAETGASVFRDNCAVCHGANLEGISGPPLSGAAFLHHWANGRRPLDDLHFIVSKTMPLQKPGSLSTADYLNVMAFLLLRNGYSVGDVPLGAANLSAVFTLPGRSAEASTALRSNLLAPPATVVAATTAVPSDTELLMNGDADWLMYNKDYRGQRYSGLTQITVENANKLGPTCMFQTGEIGSFEASPVVYDGVMYITTAYDTFALDSQTCRKIWQNTRTAEVSTASVLTRGLALYNGRVFRSTPDGHLIALDAKNGKLLWDVWMSDANRGYWLSAAPVAYRGKVFMGEAGADFGANAHIYAFDNETGRRLWTFDVIATGSQPGAASWKGGTEHGGGSIWSSFTISPEDGLLYVSTGNPAPSFDGSLRQGSNLYTDAVVALDASTGKLVWWVQQNPHDFHDWDTAAAPVVFDQDGKQFIAAADKGGWLQIYDRRSQKLLARPEVSDHENIDVPITSKGTHVCPGLIGGVEWNGPAYSPRDRALFVGSVHWCGTYKTSVSRYVEGSSYFGGSFAWDDADLARGWIRAFDASTGKPLWVYDSATPMVAALTPTAGGVLFTGDLNGDFITMNARTGKVLYRFNTGGAIAGAASTYLAGGRQFVAVTSGNASHSVWHTTGAATVVVFSLPKEN